MLSLSLSLHLFFPRLLIPFIFFIWENLTGPLDSADVPLPPGSPLWLHLPSTPHFKDLLRAPHVPLVSFRETYLPLNGILE